MVAEYEMLRIPEVCRDVDCNSPIIWQEYDYKDLNIPEIWLDDDYEDLNSPEIWLKHIIGDVIKYMGEEDNQELSAKKLALEVHSFNWQDKVPPNSFPPKELVKICDYYLWLKYDPTAEFGEYDIDTLSESNRKSLANDMKAKSEAMKTGAAKLDACVRDLYNIGI